MAFLFVEAPLGIDDRWVRAVGIPAFGAGIPRITGLLDGAAPAGPHAAAYWLGSAAFVALAAAIWHGNRWLLFEQRRHWDWFESPGPQGRDAARGDRAVHRAAHRRDPGGVVRGARHLRRCRDDPHRGADDRDLRGVRDPCLRDRCS